MGRLAFTLPHPLPSLTSSSRCRPICAPVMASKPRNGRSGKPNNPSKRPRHASSAYSRCLQLASRPDKRAARAAFREAIGRTPSDVRYWLAWANMEQQAGNWQAATNVYADGLEALPENIKLIHAWAMHEGKQRNVGQARAIFQRGIDINPYHPLAWQGLALLEQKEGNIETARNIFRDAVEAAPHSAVLWSSWAVLEYRSHEYERATELFENAVDLGETHWRAFQTWALASDRLGKPERGEQLFRRAIECNPNSVPAHRGFALFEAKHGRVEHARELYKRATEIDPRNAPVWHSWALLEEREGRYDVARTLFENAVDLSPSNVHILKAWSKMELQLGHIDTSAEWAVLGLGDSRDERRMRELRKESSKSQLRSVAQNLKMLRRVIERRSDEDVTTVMKWMSSRAKTDRDLYNAFQSRGDSDFRTVSKWVNRRSNADIKSFKDWIGERYDRDRRIGVYLFNWDIPTRRKEAPYLTPEVPELVPDAMHDELDDAQDTPQEWMLLPERPSTALKNADEEIYAGEGLGFVADVAENLSVRAALMCCLGSMSAMLALTSVHFYEKGYWPAGSPLLQDSGRESRQVVPPSGVDAPLYDSKNLELLEHKSIFDNIKK